jgi:hypothetical protein
MLIETRSIGSSSVAPVFLFRTTTVSTRPFPLISTVSVSRRARIEDSRTSST